MTTLRQQLSQLLRDEELDAMELSQFLSIPEKEVYAHLEHVVRTLARSGERLVVTPYRCLDCDYLFASRQRLDRPGRCPTCRGSHIRMARYTITRR